jgi:hypothetical protein
VRLKSENLGAANPSIVGNDVNDDIAISASQGFEEPVITDRWCAR